MPKGKDEPLPFPTPAVPPQLAEENDAKAQQKFAKQILDDFFLFPIAKAQRALETRTAEEWEEAGAQRAIHVFHTAAKRVPAYKDFLKKHKINPKKVKAIKDFQSIPTIDKENYLKKYPLEALSWDGNLFRSSIISVSSGSTGKPFLWPREDRLELETTYFFELILESFFKISERKTLIVDCFAMGMYVGGPFFLNATLRISQKGYPAMVATPGNVMDDILRIVQEVAPHYEQVILSGYPPFLKDVIENGREAGIDWSQFRTILFPAGEGFSEPWRDAVSAASKQDNILTDFLSYYGTADAAVLGIETPWSVCIRKHIAQTNGLGHEIFGQSRLPALMQYIPTMRYFEQINNELCFTSANGTIPLIRYNIHDDGDILSYNDITRIAKTSGLDITAQLQERGVQQTPWQLPHVYVFGRSDHTVILYGANIYPENIKTALESGLAAAKCSGRFMMETEEDHHHNQHLNIHIECKKGIKPTAQLRQRLTVSIIEILEEANAEYVNMHRAVGDRATPYVFLHEYGNERYFPRTKQKQSWKKR